MEKMLLLAQNVMNNRINTFNIHGLKIEYKYVVVQ